MSRDSIDAVTSLTDQQQTTWTNFQRLGIQLTARIQRELTDATGMSEADYHILTALADTPGDAVRAIALRCGLQWEKSRLSHQLRRMEGRGLIAREECAEDGRAAMVRVTPQGRLLAEAGREVVDDAVARYVVAALTPEQLRQMDEISVAIADHLGPSAHHGAGTGAGAGH